MKKITNLNAKYITNNSGITLIALIITIIVMLILAGVVLNLVIGKRGIFRIAKESKTEHIIAEMREELELALNDLQLEKQGNATIDDVTQEWADNNKLKEYGTIIEDGAETNQKTATMTKDGVTVRFVIDEKLNIIEAEQVMENEQYQTITMNLSEGIAIDNKETKTAYDKPYSATVSGEGEYALETLTVTMGGEPVTVDIGTGKIDIEKVTGDIVITATAKKLDMQITEPIIGTSTSATTSVNDNSQTKGTKLYINFSAILEGTNCTIVYKEDNTKTIPFEVTSNGKYVFVIKGTYNGKSIEKEKEVEVKKYKSAVGLVKYDAGEWTESEIQELQNLKLYDLNSTHTYNNRFKLDEKEGLAYTFGGFTYKGSTDANKSGVITNRNKSVNPQNDYGTTLYDGWQLMKTEKKQDDSGNIIKNNDGTDRIYVKSIIHAGSPENFVLGYGDAGSNQAWSACYLLSSGNEYKEWSHIISTGTNVNARNWDMYKDKSQENLIKNVHIMTNEELSNNLQRDFLKTGSCFWVTGTTSYYGLALYYYAGNTGHYNGQYASQGCLGIRPVVEMVDGVYIASGSGTEADPYVLAKE